MVEGDAFNRSGAPRQIGDERIEAVISRTLESLPADGTHWSSRGRGSCAALPSGDRAKPDGQGERPVHRHGAADLAGLRPAAAPGRDLQALDRPRLRRQGARRGRAGHGPAGPGAGPVRRREKPDPGARPHPAAAADAPGPGRAALARPQAAMARPRCSRRSMSPPGGSSANASPGTGPPSSVASSTRSRRMSPPMSTFISSWTTMPPTRRRPSATG